MSIADTSRSATALIVKKRKIMEKEGISSVHC